MCFRDPKCVPCMLRNTLVLTTCSIYSNLGVSLVAKVHAVGGQPCRTGAVSAETETNGLRRKERSQHAGDSCVQSRRHRIHQRLWRFTRHSVFNRYVCTHTHIHKYICKHERTHAHYRDFGTWWSSTRRSVRCIRMRLEIKNPLGAVTRIAFRVF